MAKFLDAKVKLLGGSHAAAIIAIGADYNEAPAEAERVLTDFAAELADLSPSLLRATVSP